MNPKDIENPIAEEDFRHQAEQERQFNLIAEFVGKDKFEKNWENLMPVIEKISCVVFDDESKETVYPRTFGMYEIESGNWMFRFNRYPLFKAQNLIDAAYDAVLNFLESEYFEESKLDEKGFVFIDKNGNPFWAAIIHDMPMLCYWHKEKRWVNLRKLRKNELPDILPLALPDKQAKIYHDLHENNAPRMTPREIF